MLSPPGWLAGERATQAIEWWEIVDRSITSGCYDGVLACTAAARSQKLYRWAAVLPAPPLPDAAAAGSAASTLSSAAIARQVPYVASCTSRLAPCIV